MNCYMSIKIFEFEGKTIPIDRSFELLIYEILDYIKDASKFDIDVIFSDDFKRLDHPHIRITKWGKMED